MFATSCPEEGGMEKWPAVWWVERIAVPGVGGRGLQVVGRGDGADPVPAYCRVSPGPEVWRGGRG